ncbi:protease modulator HflK [Paenibacillus montaniterrae]|uniref:Protein HflK n=1 Tax=Paenibacillus montaniterrae TaxID=429341 RepID=A0A920CWY3_9BACL|nr:FtsH protease activity modulator HflK [Paenibacillus montaniterrae]GIP15755.1 protease modulator HflK [Paenibacillus montaniterrae]
MNTQQFSPEPGAPKPNKPEINMKSVRKFIIGAIVVIALIYIASTSFYTVEERERAVVYTFGKITHEEGSGLHFKLPHPIQKVEIVPAELTQTITIGYRESSGGDQVVEEEAMMITGDENIVAADAVITWKINNIKNYLTNIENPETFLRNSAIASIRSVIGAQKLDYVITDGKTEIQEQARIQLVELMDHYDTGIQIIDLKFQDIEPPDGEVSEAFRAVTNAREQKNTKINNAMKYENDRIPKARGEAQALIEQAEAEKASRILNAQGDVAKFNAIYEEYANNKEITESRLVLETLEKILPNAKIFVTNSNSDTVNYLPLNDLMNRSGSSSSSSKGTTGQSSTSTNSNEGQAATQ